MRDYFYSNIALYFYRFVPLTKDHLSYKITFWGPMGWSHIIRLTAYSDEKGAVNLGDPIHS